LLNAAIFLTLGFTAALVWMSVLDPGRCGHTADVMIDSSQTFKTIEGWGSGSGNLGGSSK
jgi:hypothetical protein